MRNIILLATVMFSPTSYSEKYDLKNDQIKNYLPALGLSYVGFGLGEIYVKDEVTKKAATFAVIDAVTLSRSNICSIFYSVNTSWIFGNRIWL